MAKKAKSVYANVKVKRETIEKARAYAEKKGLKIYAVVNEALEKHLLTK